MPIIDREGRDVKRTEIPVRPDRPWVKLIHASKQATIGQKKLIRRLILEGRLERIPLNIYHNLTRLEAHQYIEKALRRKERVKMIKSTSGKDKQYDMLTSEEDIVESVKQEEKV